MRNVYDSWNLPEVWKAPVRAYDVAWGNTTAGYLRVPIEYNHYYGDGTTMKSKAALWRICEDIYIELFRKATPSLDFKDVLKRAKNGLQLRQNWFLQYHLNEDTQFKIIARHCKKHHLTPREEQLVRVEITLGCAPAF